MKNKMDIKIQELFIPYDVTKKLIKKGFNEPSLGVIYHDGEIATGSYGKFAEIMIKKDKECIKAITIEQAVRWFREEYKLNVYVTPMDLSIGVKWYVGVQKINLVKNKEHDRMFFEFTTPERNPIIIKSPYKALIKAINLALKQISK